MTSALGSLLGSLRPRVELRPPSDYSLGPEAVELAAMGGIHCEDWQAGGLDIMLSVRPDGKWAAREYAELVGRQEGKSIGIGVPRGLFGLLALRERLIMWSAHEYKTAMESFLQARDAFFRLGEVAGPNLVALDDGALFVKINNTNGEEAFELFEDLALAAVGRWRFIARSKGSGRGFSGDCNIIDEAFAYTRAQQSALAPTMLARPNPQSIYLSSPPLDGNSGEVLYALAKRAAKRAARLGYRDWGLEMILDELRRMTPDERAAFLDDRANWAASLPALGRGRVDEEAVQQLRDEMDDYDFAREVVGCWPKQTSSENGWAVIAEDAWRCRGEAEARPDGDVAFCLDASWPDAAMGAVAVAGRRELDDGKVEFNVQVLAHRPGTRWMVEYAKGLAERHPDAVFVLDKKGPAGHLLRDLQELDLELVTPAIEDVAHAFGSFVAEVVGDEPRLRHYDQAELDDALKSAGTRNLSDARTWARQGETDISPLTAATGALWGAMEREAEPWAEWG